MGGAGVWCLWDRRNWNTLLLLRKSRQYICLKHRGGKRTNHRFVNELHESEKKLLKSGKPLLEGYPAWVAGQCQGGQLSRLDCIVSIAKVAKVA